MRAIISNKAEIAKGTLLVEFELFEKVSFKPGQYFSLTLFNPPYNNDERGSQRVFSIVNSPNEAGALTIATRISESAFKKSLNALPIESEVEVGAIAGSFTLPEEAGSKGGGAGKDVVFIAGGVGITPFMSMLRYAKEEKLTYDNKKHEHGLNITLLYSNRNIESTAFFEELQELGKSMPNFRLVMTMTDDAKWAGEKRRIDAQFIKDHVAQLDESIFMTAGPPVMVKAINDALVWLGIKSENIITEDFSGY